MIWFYSGCTLHSSGGFRICMQFSIPFHLWMQYLNAIFGVNRFDRENILIRKIMYEKRFHFLIPYISVNISVNIWGVISEENIFYSNIDQTFLDLEFVFVICWKVVSHIFAYSTLVLYMSICLIIYSFIQNRAPFFFDHCVLLLLGTFDELNTTVDS